MDFPVETTVIEEKKYKTFSAMLLGLEPHKDTAKGLHIKADGHIKVTIEEKSSPIHMGDTIILNGTPKKLYLTEERGTIDRRNKAIRNGEMASIFEGTYKIVDIHELQPYKLASYVGYYQRYLHSIGSMRSTVETLRQRPGPEMQRIATAL